MVLLRLTVKIFPGEQLIQQRSTSFGDGEDSDEDPHNTISFLMVLPQPEQVTLRQLAQMIQMKWRQLQPNADPLEIKKLVDDEHENDALASDLTVADVFVDHGKALADGLDQRGAIRVIQMPGRGQRLSSVVQDWTAYPRQLARANPTKRLPPVPLFPASPTSASGAGLITAESVSGPSRHSSHPRESDIYCLSTERHNEPSNKRDNHTMPSPVLVEDSQKQSRRHIKGKSRALPGDDNVERREVRESVAPAQANSMDTMATLEGAVEIALAAQRAALPLSRQPSPPNVVVFTKHSMTPHPSLRSNSKLRSAGAKPDKPKATLPKRNREETEDDIYLIPSTDVESEKPTKPQPAKRRSRNTISRTDQYILRLNTDAAAAAAAEKAGGEENNEIDIDSNASGDVIARQTQADDNIALDDQTTIRRGTRRSNLRGPGRKSMALELSLTPPDNLREASPVSTPETTKAPRIDIPPFVIDSDAEMIEDPRKPNNFTGGRQLNSFTAGGNKVVGGKCIEGASGVTTRADSMRTVNSAPTPVSGSAIPAKVDTPRSEPTNPIALRTDISNDSISPPSGHVIETKQITTPKKPLQKFFSVQIDRSQNQRNGISASELQRTAGRDVLDLTKDTDSNRVSLSHISPRRLPPGPGQLGLGITASPPKGAGAISTSEPAAVSDNNSTSKTHLSTTAPFPCPRNQTQTDRRSSLLEPEGTVLVDPSTPIQSALCSTQKSSPRAMSTRQSVSCSVDPKVEKAPTPASAPLVRYGSSIFPAHVTDEYVARVQLGASLKKKIENGKRQGKSEEYLRYLNNALDLSNKIHAAINLGKAHDIAKYQLKLKKIQKIIEEHPEDCSEEGHPEEENQHGKFNKSLEHATIDMGQNKSRLPTELDATSGEGSPITRRSSRINNSSKAPTDASAFGPAQQSRPSHDIPFEGGLEIAPNSPSESEDEPLGKNGEQAKVAGEKNELKRKRSKSEFKGNPSGSEHQPPHSELQSSKKDPEPDPKKKKSDTSEKGIWKKPEMNNKIVYEESVDGQSSSSDSDSDSDSGSSPIIPKARAPKGLPLPARVGVARKFITPFSKVKQKWPPGPGWLPDEQSGGENERTVGATKSGTPPCFQPVFKASQKASETNGELGVNRQRETLKSLIQRHKGSEDESSAKNASENESLPSGSRFSRLNGLFRSAGLY
ncbi:hypothetical protein PAAG_06071 [Paracoccidioides lutzii Pb01]|uniref:Nucleolar protein Dnt1-like N-terminal domain-containing protein n=1 Tax=Paracoccidioides lutzii (strain ATCC MYA-826 / Pb01) TaxID=502779 RepID=C1H5W1_PARBA|nr:hypothetical protein PAAG_06071 [Paracoccidioides lutzii Pb01]EEH35024.2 hypothetical protein PAAG_06071 [Paracoccidioides lutzii Pb01]